MNRYPMSYFSSLFPPRRIFGQRQSLSVWQMVLTTLFLMSLLFIPVSLQVGQLTTYPLERIVSGVYDPLTKEVMAHLGTGEWREGQLVINEATFPQVSFGPILPAETGIVYQFAKDKLAIHQDDLLVVEVPYSQLSSKDLQTKEQLTATLSDYWFSENRFGISLFLIGTSCLILGTNFLLLVLGSSLILYLASLTKWFDLKGFRQAYTFTLNCLGLPTILTCLIGLFGQPMTTLIMVQNSFFILLLVLVFFKTRFKDEP
ncbi:maltodextrin utilization protein YvdJ [Streptococcus rupicaprae]|uniref:Maltodextrin utilization protein YvdJ n=1 Tax=Streptococcus rupicaprae TaxID=759619 RepID=A0ABV2FIS5_9STRE